MSTLHAQPYDLHAAGFYFESLEEFDAKSSALRNEFGQPVEEFEIQFIDGDNANLFEVAGINQANLELWFDQIEDLDENTAEAVEFLMSNNGYDLATAIDKADDVQVFEGSLIEYAQDLVSDCYDLPEIAECYFDYESFARDLQIGGDVAEIRPGVWCVNPHDL